MYDHKTRIKKEKVEHRDFLPQKSHVQNSNTPGKGVHHIFDGSVRISVLMALKTRCYYTYMFIFLTLWNQNDYEVC